MTSRPFRPAPLIALAAVALLAGACNSREAKTDEDMKKSLDQIVQSSKETTAATREVGMAVKSELEELRKMSARVEELEKSVRAMTAAQRRSAVYLPMESETVCDNDASCEATARSVCNKVGYPKAIASRYTPGTRATLNSVVCFD